MCDLLLIADDLTGTFDCSVAFGSGVEVWTRVPDGLRAQSFAGAAPVVAVNADTRHLVPERAAEVVGALVRAALEAGVGTIYKKCDSALRGNVGAELGALHEVAGGPVWFAPAFPKMGRVTRGGVQYVDGVPVAESALGSDPFEPVRHSAVAEVIAEQSPVSVRVADRDAVPQPDGDGITVFDAETEGDLRAIARAAWELPEPRLLAGCAGLSSVLAATGTVAPVEAGGRSVAQGDGLLVFCGSVNPVSQGQCAHATGAGAPTVTYTDAQKRDDAYLASDEGRAMVRRAAGLWGSVPLAVVDASDLGGGKGTVVAEDVRAGICAHLGQAAARIAKEHGSGDLMVMGGDVLAAFLAEMGTQAVRMLGEVVPGVVMFTFTHDAATWRVVSKSGSFGRESLFVDLAGQVR